MPKLDRAGVQIHYEDHGSGPPILLTHGYSATSAMWDEQVQAFSDRYRIITWDMRGHGASDSPEDAALYSEEATVADMVAILEACGVQETVIGGLSLGGYMSLAFYLAHPQAVRALLLFDTGPGYRSAQAREAWNVTAEARAVRFETEGLAALSSGAEVRRSRHQSAAGLAHAARGMLAQFSSNVIDGLPSITVPTLNLVGETDAPYLAATDYMAAKIPGARKVVIADAGHSSNIDQPAAFNAAMDAFLTDAGIS